MTGDGNVTHEDMNILKGIMEPLIARIEQKIDDHMERMDNECEDNQRKFTELYISRNEQDKRLTMLETGVKLISAGVLALIAIMGVVAAFLA